MLKYAGMEVILGGKSKNEGVALINEAGSAVVAVDTGDGFHVSKFQFDRQSREWRMIETSGC